MASLFKTSWDVCGLTLSPLPLSKKCLQFLPFPRAPKCLDHGLICAFTMVLYCALHSNSKTKAILSRKKFAPETPFLCQFIQELIHRQICADVKMVIVLYSLLSAQKTGYRTAVHGYKLMKIHLTKTELYITTYRCAGSEGA